MATLSIIGGAQAQSTVTLFGIVDAAVSHYGVSGGQNLTALTNSGLNSSRLGFRGTEDLGGGMSAGFWLEGALSNDNGNAAGLNFQRRSTVSLSGPFGEIRLGRDYTPTFWNDTVFDPFGTNGVGTNLLFKARSTVATAPFTASSYAANPNYVRANNTVGYFLPPNLGGFYGQVQYAFDEQTTQGNHAGRYAGLRAGFASGPVDVAISFGKTSGSTPLAQATPDATVRSIAGSYDLKAIKLVGEYGKDKYENNLGSANAKGYLLGAVVPVGVGEIKASYSHVQTDATSPDAKASQYALGYVHSLSKRTALYATYARVSNGNGAMIPVVGGASGVTGIANKSSSGYDIGIRHSF